MLAHNTYMKSVFTKTHPEKRLTTLLPKHSGRDNSGQVSVRHQGGRKKRFLRTIDFKRDKKNVAGRVFAIEYDPNRSANIALLVYADGGKHYILAPEGLNVNDMVRSGEDVEIRVGNSLPLAKIPIGVAIHNIELTPGQGGQIIRSAGSAATIIAKDEAYAQVKLPSGELRLVSLKSYATIGQVGNIAWKERVIGTAGRARRMGRRPTVRGVAMHPDAHPHGGGEGRSGEGMPPKTPWGKPARGKKTRKKGKWSDQFIIQRKKK